MPIAIPNTNAVVDAIFISPQKARVESASEFLNRLRAAGVTQQQIAKVLKISQPNAATLYTPGKNGKLRTLKWDEGALLAREFQIPLTMTRQVFAAPSAETLAPILDALLPLVPKAGASESAVRALSEALVRGLQLLGGESATPATQGELQVAARGAVARFRDLSLQ